MKSNLAQRYRELRDVMIDRKKKREKNYPRYMAPTETKLPSYTHRFFVDRHADNESVIQDLHRIETFVDKISKKSRKQVMNPNIVKQEVARELKRLQEVRQKFTSLMKSHPYDTFFDESVLTEVGFDNFTF